MKFRALFSILAFALFLSGCASQQPVAQNEQNPAVPAEGPTAATRPEQTTDNLPQLTTPVF